jgi:reactive intermediate/imine deaminase
VPKKPKNEKEKLDELDELEGGEGEELEGEEESEKETSEEELEDVVLIESPSLEEDEVSMGSPVSAAPLVPKTLPPLEGENVHFIRVTASPLLAPGAIGPYSQAMRVGKLLSTVPQLPIDPKSGKLVQGSFKDRVRQIMKNIAVVCELPGSNLSKVVKLSISLLTFDNNNFDAVNEVMREFFNEPYPARATVIVLELPKGADVSIEAMFLIP